MAVMSGWCGAYPVLEGKEAAKSGDNPNLTPGLAFKVGGTAALPDLPPQAPLALNPPPATAAADTVAKGTNLYVQFCSVCHGENAIGGGVVPDLRASSFIANDFFYEIVLYGAMKGAGMAAFGSVLSKDDAAAIRAYLIQRANQDKAADKTAGTP